MMKLKDLKARFMENPEFREEYVRSARRWCAHARRRG